MSEEDRLRATTRLQRYFRVALLKRKQARFAKREDLRHMYYDVASPSQPDHRMLQLANLLPELVKMFARPRELFKLLATNRTLLKAAPADGIFLFFLKLQQSQLVEHIRLPFIAASVAAVQQTEMRFVRSVIRALQSVREEGDTLSFEGRVEMAVNCLVSGLFPLRQFLHCNRDDSLNAMLSPLIICEVLQLGAMIYSDLNQCYLKLNRIYPAISSALSGLVLLVELQRIHTDKWFFKTIILLLQERLQIQLRTARGSQHCRFSSPRFGRPFPGLRVGSVLIARAIMLEKFAVVIIAKDALLDVKGLIYNQPHNGSKIFHGGFYTSEEFCTLHNGK